ncbi:hypothetical protein C1H46_043576 [Malus baccata]|uniref:Uncharacterized protein n=1 Tax=Malus baccata TaxID=106549 RepID=A0A540K9Q2_MALBA|nr:hypothetical protein C1H46_043576 [Malus baccata]
MISFGSVYAPRDGPLPASDLTLPLQHITSYRFLFSEVVPGRVLDRDIKIPPPGVRDMLRFHLKGPEYKMKLAVEEGIWAWISLLFMDNGDEGVVDVFGIEMDFMDAANSKEEVLKLLDMLDWK